MDYGRPSGRIEIFLTVVSFSMDNGRRVKIWKDKWFGDKPLCVSFTCHNCVERGVGGGFMVSIKGRGLLESLLL